jgi:hypothetical protein
MGKLVRKRSNDGNNSGESVSSSDEPATKQLKCKSCKGEDSAQSRLGHWEKLLKERPEGLDTMDVWIGRVISTSDPETLLPNDYTIKPKDKSISRKFRWNSLLKQRPGTDATKEDVNKWLTQVLQVSAVSEEEQDESAEKEGD